jgi:hypothetical protein
LFEKLSPIVQFFQMLLNGHNVNGADYDNRTALMVAANKSTNHILMVIKIHLLSLRAIMAQRSQAIPKCYGALMQLFKA